MRVPGYALQVMEETGIKTKFVSLAAIREGQTGPFNTTDCYCVCVMALDGEALRTLPSSPVHHPTEYRTRVLYRYHPTAVLLA
eukprot:COSAG05_NODE_3949_length_1755_cov_10.933575_2_plen_82_part_01